MGEKKCSAGRFNVAIALDFSGDLAPELEKVNVTLPNGDKLEAESGVGDAGVFVWGPGPKAVSHFLLRYAAWCQSGNAPERFRYGGNKPWHVALGNVFNKDLKNNWMARMFGVLHGHSHLWFWTIRKNPEGARGKPRVFRLKVNQLPPDALTFRVDGKALKTAEALEGLARKIEEHWEGGRIVNNRSDPMSRFLQEPPLCPACGQVAVHDGSCYRCLNCAESGAGSEEKSSVSGPNAMGISQRKR